MWAILSAHWATSRLSQEGVFWGFLSSRSDAGEFGSI